MSFWKPTEIFSTYCMSKKRIISQIDFQCPGFPEFGWQEHVDILWGIYSTVGQVKLPALGTGLQWEAITQFVTMFPGTLLFVFHLQPRDLYWSLSSLCEWSHGEALPGALGEGHWEGALVPLLLQFLSPGPLILPWLFWTVQRCWPLWPFPRSWGALYLFQSWFYTLTLCHSAF